MNEELERITIFNSYVRSIDQLARWDMQLAQELSYWIIQFWIKWIEPPADSNPFMLSVFEQIKEPLMNGRKKSMNGKTKSKSDEEEIKEETENDKTKSKQNQNEIKTESNENQNEIKPWQNIKYKRKKKKEENNISLSNDNESASTVDYWDSEINECLEIIKSFNGWIIDWTQKSNRIRWKNLIWKLKKSEFVQNQNYTRQNTLTAVLKVVSQNKFYVSKITSPELIYKNLAILFQVCRQEWMNQTPQIEVL